MEKSAEVTFENQYVSNSFSVRIARWSSPRLVCVDEGLIYFQAATCYPCSTCDMRVTTLKMALNGEYCQRIGLGLEPTDVAKVADKKSYETRILDQFLYFVIPLPAGMNPSPREISSFLGRTFNVAISINDANEGSMEIPRAVSYSLAHEPKKLSLADVEELQEKLRQSSVVNMEKFTNNRILLVTALAACDYLVGTSMEKVVESLETFREKNSDLALNAFKNAGIGGMQSRALEVFLNGNYYNYVATLYLIHCHGRNITSIGDTDWTLMQILGAKVRTALEDALGVSNV